MKLHELKKLLKRGEWNDVEFKEAKKDVPKSAFETVSAFANSHGGLLIFGIAQAGEDFNVVGVESPDRLASNFLSALHADHKVNHEIQLTADRMKVLGKTVLIFTVAQNSRVRKPVYLDGDIRRTFLRRAGGDFKARPQDIERLLRDATADRWDGQVFERVPLVEALHPATLRWYRERFRQFNPAIQLDQTDTEFLYHWGYLRRDGRRFLPTRAAIMLFGSPVAIHQLLPRPTLDIQFLGFATNESLPETRWIDRIICEENIIQSWENLVEKYKFFMPRPFRNIDPITLGRLDDPPGFRVFREAAINLLIHQDYGDHSRKAVIKFYRDGIQFWNPGDVFGDDSRLLDPGEKDVRNPAITMALRRIHLCEQAGTGMRMIREEWIRQGHQPPAFKNDRSWKAFELFIPGLDKEVDMASDLLKKMFGKSSGEVDGRPGQATGQDTDQVTGQVTGQDTGQDTGQEAGQVADPANHGNSADEIVLLILKVLEKQETSAAWLMKQANFSHRQTFRENYLTPALVEGFIERTIPDKPNSKNQKYRLTAKGREKLKHFTRVRV